MRTLLLAILSGILFGLSWPTYGHPAFVFVAFIPLLFIELRFRESGIKKKQQNLKSYTGWRVFLHSYLAFFIWNVIATWWVYYSTAGGAVFAILANSLLMSMTFMGYHWIAKKLKSHMALAFFICIWLSFEKFHLGWDFSWPWLNLGNVFADKTMWIQWYEYTGSFGGSLWVLLVNVVLFRLISRCVVQKVSIKKMALRAGVQSLLWIFIPIVISTVIFYTLPDRTETEEVVVIQPNIDPYGDKYNTSNIKIVRQLIEQADQVVTADTKLILAPETVIADDIRIKQWKNDRSLLQLAHYARAKNLDILTGVSFIDIFYNEDQVSTQSNRYKDQFWYNSYNSGVLLRSDTSGEIYHKSKLVVGVEHFPYKSVLQPILGDALLNLGGTVSTKTTQEERTSFDKMQGVSTGATICYESIYGEYVGGYVRNGAQFLSIITNDAWWSDSQGHKQHFAYAKLRAIEYRRDVARAANTGISGFINYKGEVLQRSNYDEKTALRGNVQPSEVLTFYAEMGDYIPRTAIFMAVMLILITFRQSLPNIKKQKSL